jgi:Mn2+/Fe2+ NRAMP family transporter
MSTELVSTGTIVTIVVGAIIAYYYLYYMSAALRKSVRTRDEKDDGPEENYSYSLIGAVVSVIVSILSIAIYGCGAAFLYWGPIVALLAALAVAYSLREEVAS